MARYGLMVSDVQDTVSVALGGEAITTTVEGRERYGVICANPRDLRSDPQSIAPASSVIPAGRRTVPLGDVAESNCRAARRRSAPKTDNWRSTYLWIYRAAIWADYVKDAKAAVAASNDFPQAPMWLERAFEFLERLRTARLKLVVPVTLLIIFLLLFSQLPPPYRDIHRHVVAALRDGRGLWLMWWLGFNFSVAVAVGFIALAGVARKLGLSC